jgi:predicted Zn-dependent protease
MIRHRSELIFLVTFTLIVGCSKVPITNRKQLNMLPESELISLSLNNYSSFLSKNPPINGTADAKMVKRVGERIQGAVARFMAERKLSKRLANYRWEYNLVDDKEANAWCMPGGKVVVYNGLLPLTQDETSLAIVMGHEIAHAVARHGNERMSQGLLVQMGGIALALAMQNKPEMTQQVFLQSYGIGSTLGVLAYSRTHETEADKLGLIFAAMAGYDPRSAIGFWERMAAKGGAKPPVLLSTHPSDKQRVETLKAFMPNALKYYKPS